MKLPICSHNVAAIWSGGIEPQFLPIIATLWRWIYMLEAISALQAPPPSAFPLTIQRRQQPNPPGAVPEGSK